MLPSWNQIEVASYHRWERRGRVHGHDREDWLAAEQELLFRLNYEVVARHLLRGAEPSTIGARERPTCRFCERAAPRTTFAERPLTLPGFLGNTSLRSLDICDECHAAFLDSGERDLERLAAPFLATPDASRNGPNGAIPPPRGAAALAARPFVPIAAFKCLTRLALSILPEAELASTEDAIEWVSNPDHDFDSGLFADLTCLVHFLPAVTATPWTALARRTDDAAPVPYLLFFIATGAVIFQCPIPLCARDEDLDGERRVVPRLGPAGLGAELDPIATAAIPLASSKSSDAVPISFL